MLAVLLSDPPPDVIQSLVDEGYVLSQGLTPQVAYYRFHFHNEYGANQLLRQAVQYAIDREAIARDLFRDTAIPAYGLLSPGAPADEPTLSCVSPVLSRGRRGGRDRVGSFAWGRSRGRFSGRATSKLRRW